VPREAIRHLIALQPHCGRYADRLVRSRMLERRAATPEGG
jgi:hypothetical protein